jgi:hypothetical protein
MGSFFSASKRRKRCNNSLEPASRGEYAPEKELVPWRLEGMSQSLVEAASLTRADDPHQIVGAVREIHTVLGCAAIIHYRFVFEDRMLGSLSFRTYEIDQPSETLFAKIILPEMLKFDPISVFPKQRTIFH